MHWSYRKDEANHVFSDEQGEAEGFTIPCEVEERFEEVVFIDGDEIRILVTVKTGPHAGHTQLYTYNRVHLVDSLTVGIRAR